MTLTFSSSREIKLFWQFSNGCDGKASYPSKIRAEMARDARIRKTPGAVKRIGGTLPYECKFCGGWHLGHPR